MRNLIFTTTDVNGPSLRVTNVELCARLSWMNIGEGHGRVVVLGLGVIEASRTAGEVGCSSKGILARPTSLGRSKTQRQTAW